MGNKINNKTNNLNFQRWDVFGVSKNSSIKNNVLNILERTLRYLETKIKILTSKLKAYGKVRTETFMS